MIISKQPKREVHVCRLTRDYYVPKVGMYEALRLKTVKSFRNQA